MNEFEFKDLKIGMTQEFEHSFNEKDLIKFKEISGDLNPMHLDKESAMNFGFKSNFLYGLLTQSLLSKLSGTIIPGKYSIILSVKSDFLKPVYPNDVLCVKGKVSKLVNATKIVYMETEITRKNEKILRGEMLLKMLK